ncbi:Clp protease N-terminal domain-containing protein [Streptomyces flaveus]|uniref:Clp R domain-containing protein n=1 Tax=Streptomyces flaveus TaxID=66370 RepID=A0A917VP54_9ACTN|nr:Clp protease N-terminal domain-containing protein [Streptomyces flaveus]GGL04581.1 hypothetical protein GCM10010094_76790 [Streptomyces flaveus]
MHQRPTTGAHADATAMAVLAGAPTEFELDVMDLLVKALREAVKLESPAVGTEHLLSALVMGETEAGSAIAPGIRKAGSLSGLVSGRAGSGGAGWANDDGDGGTPVEATDEDEAEVTATWREAQWRLGLETGASRGSHKTKGPAGESGRPLPVMTDATRMCLLLALRSARTEGTVAVRCRHVARALLNLPASRAREALVVERLDLAAAATALDALDARASAETEGPESRGVLLLRRAGTLGKSGNRLSRAITSWTSGASVYGSPVMFAVTGEAARQAARYGRGETEPVDLLLGILALDRALAVAGRSLPEDLASVSTAAELLRRHGVRHGSLARSATISTVVDSGAHTRLSDSAQQAKAAAQLIAAEQGSPTVGTAHLLAALLEAPAVDAEAGDEGRTVGRLLAAEHVDIAALRAELGPRSGA